jgi:archaellum component FlaG (FlaF/FlaG flagellin family)
MHNVIVAGLLVVASVTAATIAVNAMLPSIHQSSQSVVMANHEAARKIGTEFEIIFIAPTYSGDQIDLLIKNVGIEPIGPLYQSDIYMISPGHDVEFFTYSQAGGPGTWREQPEISSLSRGETANIKLSVSTSNPIAQGLHIVRMATPNGIVKEKSFSQ